MSTGVTDQNGLYPEALQERGVFLLFSGFQNIKGQGVR